jgi:hypothetical protein
VSEMAGVEWVQDELFPAERHFCADCGACPACGEDCTCSPGDFEYGDDPGVL